MLTMPMSPIEAYAELLHAIPRLDDATAALAAETVLQGTPWIWVVPPYNPDAPALLRDISDQQAWQRFGADTYITRQQVAVHCLYRAMTHVEDGDARALLSHLARRLLAGIVASWQANWQGWVKGQGAGA
jgi:hypothetical protein